MSSVDKLLQLKKVVEQKKEQRIRAESVRDQAIEHLREYGYDSVEEAKQALKKMKMQIAKDEAAIEEMITKLEADYPEL